MSALSVGSWDIKLRNDPPIVLAWVGDREDGTFRGSISLHIEDGVARIDSVYVQPGTDTDGLAAALFSAAIRDVSTPRHVRARREGAIDAAFITQLRESYPHIEFTLE